MSRRPTDITLGINLGKISKIVLLSKKKNASKQMMSFLPVVIAK
jgi:hypothetical protein